MSVRTSCCRLAQEALEAEARRLLAEVQRVDAEEDEKYGKEKRGDELPEQLRDPRSRVQRIAEAWARLEKVVQPQRVRSHRHCGQHAIGLGDKDDDTEVRDALICEGCAE